MRDLDELNINPKTIGLSRDEVQSLEQKLQVEFPDGYRQLLMYSQGGHPEIDSIQVTSAYMVSVDRFLLPNNQPGKGLLWYHQILTDKFGLDQKIVPIAKDGGDNLFCINFKDPIPKIIMVFHSNPLGNHLELERTFEEFINDLQKNPDYI